MITYRDMYSVIPEYILATAFKEVFNNHYPETSFGDFKEACQRRGLPDLETHEAFQAALTAALLTR